MKLCSIASGSSGNCIFAGSETTSLLIDAGISGKRVEAGLAVLDRSAKELDGILVTHEHSDHIRGLGVLARKYGIPIYSTPGTINAMLEQQLLGKVEEGLFHTVTPDCHFELGDLEVQPFRVSHDAAEPVAYRMCRGEKSVAVATDLGYYDDYIIEHLKGLDAVLLESNHDVNMLQVGSYPYYLKQRILGRRGHLSNDNAGRLLGEILNDHMKAVMLGHLSRENNYEALAMATVCTEITQGDNPYQAKDFPIEIAKRDMPSRMIAV